MIIFLHVLIALTSLAITTAAFFVPTRSKLQVSYVFVGLTLATGTYLTVLNPTHIISACTSGLFYLSLVTVGNVLAARRLSAQNN